MDGWTLLIAAHAFCATVALIVGAFNLLRRRKGDLLHRIAGWSWTAAMIFVSVSSFWIRTFNPGRLSPIHILSVITLVSLAGAIWSAARHNIASHRGFMLGSYFGLLGALVAAVAVPGRMIPPLAVHDPLTAVEALVATIAVGGVILGTAFLVASRMTSRIGGASRSRQAGRRAAERASA